MFDKLFVSPTRHTTEYVTKEIHEHRAPTDESVRLLREMEQAAVDQVVATVPIRDTNFEGLAQIYKDYAGLKTRVIVTFSLNGKKMKSEYVDWTDRMTMDSIIDGIVKEVSKTIAREVLQKAFEGLEWQSSLYLPVRRAQ